MRPKRNGVLVSNEWMGVGGEAEYSVTRGDGATRSVHICRPRGWWYTGRRRTINLVEFGASKRDCAGRNGKHGRGNARSIVRHVFYGGRVVLVLLHYMHLHRRGEDVLLVIGASDCHDREGVADAGAYWGNRHIIRLGARRAAHGCANARQRGAPIAFAAMDGSNGRERREGLAAEATTLEVELEDVGRSFGVVRERVLFYKCLGKLVGVLGEVIIEELYNLQGVICFFERSARFSTREPGKEKRAGCNSGRGVLYELAVEESDLHHKAGYVLGLDVFHDGVIASETEPSLGGGVADDPLNGVENVVLHLDEGGLVVGLTTDLCEVVDGGDAVLCVLELCGDPEGGTAH